MEITEHRGDHTSTRFTWDLLMLCGDPSQGDATYFGGFPVDQVSPISCPDNVAFDSHGNLWISTDGAPSKIGYNDGLFKVTLNGSERGRVQQFLSVPQDAETCGPVIHDNEGMVYISVQHPGEDGTFEQPRSYFPDYALPTRVKPGEFSKGAGLAKGETAVNMQYTIPVVARADRPADEVAALVADMDRY